MLNDYPVVDGFSLRSDYRCDFTLLAQAVEQYDELRRVGNYRQKQWSFPRNPVTSPIPAFNSTEQEIRVGIGAVIWGYKIALTGAGNGSVNGLQIRDACTDAALFSEPVFPAFYSIDDTKPALLPRLLVIGKPGIITVELMTMWSEPIIGQVILYGGVPVGVDR
jgi:hypothetical protein